MSKTFQNIWRKRYLELACQVSKWSKDPNAQVGAVVVDKHGRIIAVGFNGFPVNVEDSPERLSDKALKNDIVVHAELNAILVAGHAAEQGTIYVYGKPICSQCAGAIIQSGFFAVVASVPKENTESHWDKVGQTARSMFKEANIRFFDASDITDENPNIDL